MRCASGREVARAAPWQARAPSGDPPKRERPGADGTRAESIAEDGRDDTAPADEPQGARGGAE